MVRGVTILLIMTVFSQTLTGSVFDRFTTPDKKDKNQMLMYLRGMMKPQGTTTVKVTTQQNVFTPDLDSPTIKQVWEGKGLPDRSDKSKMLAYLRGLNSPSSISIYEDPQHRGVIQTLETQNTEDKQNTADVKNPVIDSSFKTPDRQVLWGNAAPVTHPTILQPEKEGDSDTCFWRGQHQQGQQPPENSYRSQLVQDDTKQLQEETKYDVGSEFESVGENVIKFWDCVKYKFFKSYDKIKVKVCGMFGGNSDDKKIKG